MNKIIITIIIVAILATSSFAASIIQIRRDTAANWAASNPTLSQGEIGFELVTAKIKIGDGATAWNALGYFTAAGTADFTGYVNTSMFDNVTIWRKTDNQSLINMVNSTGLLINWSTGVVDTNTWNSSSDIWLVINNGTFYPASNPYGFYNRSSLSNTTYPTYDFSGYVNTSMLDNVTIWRKTDNQSLINRVNQSGYIINWSNDIIAAVSGTTYRVNQTGTNGQGTITSNYIGDLWYYDSTVYNISEAAGATPLTFYMNFTNISSFNQWVTREYYLGSSSHNMQFEIYDYASLTWQSYYSIVGQSGYTIITIPVYDSTEHINNGIVQTRIRHIENGVSSHRLYVDFSWLISGANVGGSTNLEGYAKYSFGYNNFFGNGVFNTTQNITANNFCDLIGRCFNYTDITSNPYSFYNRSSTMQIYNATYHQWSFNQSLPYVRWFYNMSDGNVTHAQIETAANRSGYIIDWRNNINDQNNSLLQYVSSAYYNKTITDTNNSYKVPYNGAISNINLSKKNITDVSGIYYANQTGTNFWKIYVNTTGSLIMEYTG